MQTVPQYMTLLVRKDGEEYGLFYYGDKVKKFLSVFPSDLFQHGTYHDSAEQAIEYVGNIWRALNNIAEQTAFVMEMVRQREHAITGAECGYC